MKTTVNQLAVLKRAATMVEKGIDLGQSLNISAMIEHLQFQLMNGVSHFIYRKKDGTLREATGTLFTPIVKKHILGWGEPKRYYNCQAYFDIEKLQWRSFKYEYLVTILS